MREKYNSEKDIAVLGWDGVNKKFLIHESKHWAWILNGVPRTLGTSVIKLKRDATDLENLTDNEWLDLLNMRKLVENTMRKRFSCELVNYLMLRNEHKQIHEHVVPRYFKDMEFNGELFPDDESGTANKSNCFLGSGYTFKKEMYSEETLLMIRDELKNAINKIKR